MSSNRGFGNGRSFGNSGNAGRGMGGRLYSRFSQAPRHQQILSVVVTLLVLVLVVYLIVRVVNSYKSFHANNVKIIPGTVRMDQVIKVPGKELPLSVDQRYGVEFSYAGWHYIKDLNNQGDKGSLRHVYHKGSAHLNPNTKSTLMSGDVGPVQAPGVWLDSTTNNLHVLMNTFPTSGSTVNPTVQPSPNPVFEEAVVQNVPMNTWFHLAIVCINKNIDIFVNGRLKMRKALNGVPRLNYGDLYVGGNSYNGYLSNLYYFAHALQIFELDRLVAEGPASVMFKTPKYNEAQLAQDWYLATNYPSN